MKGKFMKKNIFISLLVAAIVATIFLGCKHFYKPYVYTPDDELYEYCAFDSLSYWIYEDSATQQIDSVVAQKKLRKRSSVTKLNGGYHDQVSTFSQQYEIVINDTSYLTTIEPEVCWYHKYAEQSDYKLTSKEYYTIPLAFLHSDIYEYIQHYPFVYANIHYPSENEYCYEIYAYKYTAFYGQYSINNKDYFDVKKIEARWSEDNDTYICYWSKNVGIIRSEVHYNDTTRNPIIKNLIRYNVVNVPNQYK